MVEWSTHYHSFNLFWTSNYLIIKVYRKSAHLSTHVLGPDRLYGALSLINQAWSRLQYFLSSSCCLRDRKWLKSPYLGTGPGLSACDLQIVIKIRGASGPLSRVVHWLLCFCRKLGEFAGLPWASGPLSWVDHWLLCFCRKLVEFAGLVWASGPLARVVHWLLCFCRKPGEIALLVWASGPLARVDHWLLCFCRKPREFTIKSL